MDTHDHLQKAIHGDIQTTRELLARVVEHLDHITGAQQQPANVQASHVPPNPLIIASSSQGSARSGPESGSHTSHQWRRLGSDCVCFVSDHVVMDKGMRLPLPRISKFRGHTLNQFL